MHNTALARRNRSSTRTRSRQRSTRLQRRHPGIAAQYEDAIKARRLGQLAGVDLEDRLALCSGGLAQVAPVLGIADQGFVTAL